jgi:hypothetical protein
MSIQPLLRLVARTLPPLARERYLEEWRADAAGATAAGLTQRDVLLGAAVLSVTIDRDLPAHTGEPQGTLPRRLSRRGFALFAAAAAILIGAYLTGGGIIPEEGAAPAGVVAALSATGQAAILLGLLLVACGALYLARASAAVQTRTARATLVAAIAGVAALLIGTMAPDAPGWLLPVGPGILALGLVGGIAVLGGTRAIALEHRAAPRRRRVLTATAGAALVLAVVAVGTVDLLIWNPVAKAPGLELSTIYSLMESRDGFQLGATVAFVAAWAAFWSVAALVTLLSASLRRARAFTTRRIAIVMLGLVGGAVFFRFFAGFGIGMSIADTFATSGGDGSVVSAILPYVGQLALAGAAIALGWAPRARALKPLNM